MLNIKAYHVHLLQDQYLDGHDSGSVGDNSGARPSDEGGRGGGGGGHPDPEIRRAVSKKIISAFRASVWSKDKGGGGEAGPHGPSPGSVTG